MSTGEPSGICYTFYLGGRRLLFVLRCTARKMGKCMSSGEKRMAIKRKAAVAMGGLPSQQAVLQQVGTWMHEA